jgi:hypothetical protein
MVSLPVHVSSSSDAEKLIPLVRIFKNVTDACAAIFTRGTLIAEWGDLQFVLDTHRCQLRRLHFVRNALDAGINRHRHASATTPEPCRRRAK